MKDEHQLFRTLNFGLLTSYSTHELMTHRFDDLFVRNEFFTKLIWQSAGKILSGERTIIEYFCPPHIVTETRKEKRSVQIEYKCMAPLIDDASGNILGVIVVERITQLSKLEQTPLSLQA